MRRFASAFFLFVLLLAMSVSAFAVDHPITVGGNGLVFTPKVIHIAPGDTVTFTNAGGFHNVAADDGSFRNGDASSGGWTFQVAYNNVGTFGHHCEIHGGPGAGMYGTVVVDPVVTPPPPPPPIISGGLSGNWYNSAQSGSGFQLEVTSNFDQMVAIWFVFDPNGGSQWIYAQGTYDPTVSTITLPAVLITGGKFPFPASNYVASDILKPSWGTMTFTFTDCNTATVDWNSTMPGYGSGSMPITRLTQIAGTTCP